MKSYAANLQARKLQLDAAKNNVARDGMIAVNQAIASTITMNQRALFETPKRGVMQLQARKDTIDNALLRASLAIKPIEGLESLSGGTRVWVRSVNQGLATSIPYLDGEFTQQMQAIVSKIAAGEQAIVEGISIQAERIKSEQLAKLSVGEINSNLPGLARLPSEAMLAKTMQNMQILSDRLDARIAQLSERAKNYQTFALIDQQASTMLETVSNKTVRKHLTDARRYMDKHPTLKRKFANEMAGVLKPDLTKSEVKSLYMEALMRYTELACVHAELKKYKRALNNEDWVKKQLRGHTAALLETKNNIAGRLIDLIEDTDKTIENTVVSLKEMLTDPLKDILNSHRDNVGIQLWCMLKKLVTFGYVNEIADTMRTGKFRFFSTEGTKTVDRVEDILKRYEDHKEHASREISSSKKIIRFRDRS